MKKLIIAAVIIVVIIAIIIIVKKKQKSDLVDKIMQNPKVDASREVLMNMDIKALKLEYAKFQSEPTSTKK